MYILKNIYIYTYIYIHIHTLNILSDKTAPGPDIARGSLISLRALRKAQKNGDDLYIYKNNKKIKFRGSLINYIGGWDWGP
jgi:hypothetical protein